MIISDSNFKPDYNIPRKIRELQLLYLLLPSGFYYNIPRKIRELQSVSLVTVSSKYYNIPRKIRELQSLIFVFLNELIITYQEK